MKTHPFRCTYSRFSIASLLVAGIILLVTSCNQVGSLAMRRSSTPPKSPVTAEGTEIAKPREASRDGEADTKESVHAEQSTPEGDTKAASKKAKRKRRKKKKKAAQHSPCQPLNEDQVTQVLPAAMGVMSYVKFMEGLFTTKHSLQTTYAQLIKNAAETIKKLGVELDEKLLAGLNKSERVSHRTETLLLGYGPQLNKELNTILEHTKQLLDSKMTVNDYLQRLLYMRRKQLKERNELIERVFAPNTQVIMIPTDPCLAKMYMDSPDFTNENRIYNELNRLYTIKRWELINFAIVEICNSIPQGALNAETKMLLRGATQLQSFVKQESASLSHPDEGTLYGQIQALLEPYIEKKNPSAWDQAYRKEIVKSMLKKDIPECNLAMVDQGHKLGIENAIVVLLVGKMIINNNLKGSYQQKISKLKEKQEAYIDWRNLESLCHAMDTFSGSTQAREEHLPPWPDFDDLFAKERQKEDTKATKPVPPSHRATSPVRPQQTTEERTVQLPAPSTSQPQPVSAPSPTPAAAPSVPEQAAATARPETKDAVAMGDVTADFPKDWDGGDLRRYHERVFKNAYPSGTFTLKPKLQAVVNDVFNPKKRNSVTFQDIKRLVESTAIGAKIHITRGTHAEIKDRDGRTIPCARLFYHGDDTTYGYTIEYVQATLLYLGLRPE